MENNEASMDDNGRHQRPARHAFDEPKAKPVEIESAEEYPEPELIDESSLADMMPSLTVNAPAEPPTQEPCIISDDQILGVYDEILNNCRKDREKAMELLATFVDLVVNDGDSSSASKEAVVNLIKVQSDTADKMSKVADLMTRIKLKERDTFPRYLAQHNNVTIESNNSKRDLLKALSKKKGK